MAKKKEAKKKKGAAQMKSSAKVDLSDRILFASHGEWQNIVSSKPDRNYWTFSSKYFYSDEDAKEYLLWDGKNKLELGPFDFVQFKKECEGLGTRKNT